MLRYIFTIVFCLCLVPSSTESQVSLTAEPGVIREGLTDSLTLTCSLQDVSTSENPQGSTGSSTQFDVEHVNSIIVFRGSANDETPVARIITTNSAEALVDQENLQVTGDLNPARSTDPKFLEMVWTVPGQQQAGQYICEVSALGMLGRGVVLKAKADVKSEAPGIQELMAEVINLKNKANSQEQRLNELTSALKPPHTEQGVVACSVTGDGWRTSGSGVAEIYKSVQFTKPYVDVPVVIVSLIVVDVENEKNTRYSIDVSNVTRTGFEIVCGTWSDSVVYRLHVRWTSTVA